jgi:predicted DNA-binding transcriptional regulator AlpA
MQTATFDIPTFCKSFKISRGLFYKLIEEGKGPRVMKVGRRTLISAEAAREWREEMLGEIDKPGLEVTIRLCLGKPLSVWLYSLAIMQMLS